MASISYAITACNEHEELKKLLEQITPHLQPEDEVVIQLDITATSEVDKVAKDSGYLVEYYPLDGDFAEFKNHLKGLCSKQYVFFLDADELISEELLEDLHGILDLNPNIDLFIFPRENFVEGITKEHLEEWGWNVDGNGRVNYPDNQGRIIKNVDYISWKRKVHECLTGSIGLLISVLPEEYHLIHFKTIQKQEAQNKMYSNM